MINRKQILLENTLWVYLAKIVTQLISLVASVMVLRQLDVDVYGMYVFLFGLFTAYQLVIVSPLKHVLLRFVPELKNTISSSSLLRLIAIYVAIALVMVVVLTIVGFVFKDFIIQIFNVETFDNHLNSFLFFVFTYAVKILLEVLLSALLLHRRIAVFNIIIAFSRAIAYLILLNQLNVNLLLIIEGAVSLIYAIPALIVLIKVLNSDNNTSGEVINKRQKQRMQRFWLYSLFTEMGAGLIGRTSDYYIVAALSSPYFVGLYGFAVKIYELFYKVLPLKEFESVLKPLVFERYSSMEETDSLNRFYNFIIKVLLPVFILPFTYFFVFGNEIISQLFGEKYLSAYWPTVIILGGFVFDGVFYPLGILIHLKEKMHVLLISRIVVVFSLVAGILMMKQFGITGVAVATVFGELLKNMLMFFMFRKYLKLTYDPKIFLSNVLLVIVLLLLFYPLHFIGNQIILLGIGTVLYAIVYGFYLINFHPFDNDELKYLESILKSNTKLSGISDHIIKVLNKIVVRKINA
ncbi:lipopolysaccharide biosynthesis protein [Carboxylicivirga caseinilyticus]|uniref:lipopolysaccharide biosynthesis protein n=1 Tax=Carboxylicivirga caseinilyticus TaxID=3417572 RepID=UPI003D328A7A|nr:polysaccharide biosynthesis C-terminal domain-containing protein [Marinilabiliaceae bacterium A049]